MRRILATLAVVLVAGTASAADVTFPLTGENTAVKFVGTKPDGKHAGGFKTLTGTASAAAGDPTSLKVEVEIDMNSTWSDDEKLTAHLKGPDFFGIKNNPKSRFVVSKVEKSGDGYTVAGELTLNGKTKPVSFPATVAVTADSLKVDASFSINRSDWGITYGKGKIDEAVGLTISVNARK
jgi:polyisoprenoid-binding protein YceI